MDDTLDTAGRHTILPDAQAQPRIIPFDEELWETVVCVKTTAVTDTIRDDIKIALHAVIKAIPPLDTIENENATLTN